MTSTPHIEPALQAFLSANQLPTSYLSQAKAQFGGLADAIIRRQQQQGAVLVGINGSQGSGKSTLADYLKTLLESQHGLTVAVVSLDDFYLGRASRQALAANLHPLLATRGVPGTHDMPLALATLTALKQQRQGSIKLPRFDKANDDCFAKNQWPSIAAPVDVTIFEGWCVGATPQSEAQLKTAINPLELKQDIGGEWRHYVNQQLAGPYQELFANIDIMAMLKAPSFSCVKGWRLEQEEKLAKKLQNQSTIKASTASQLMSAEEIGHFVMFFQRLTEHMLTTMPEDVDFLYPLDSDRHIINPETVSA